ncbi:MAG: HAD-IIB family hydrolase [Pseudomonadota bacterium]
MTRHENFTLSDSEIKLAEKDLVLAVDLDGTFLGGTDQERAQFYAWIESHRDRVGLIFVTGRDPGFITNLTRKQGVPRPDYVVADVGTTVARVEPDHKLAPITEIETEIADAWGDKGQIVQSKLHHADGLTLQSTGFRYRVSYHLDQDQFDSSVLDTIADLGLDAIVSDSKFLDVLPKDVSKGPSLLKLLTFLGVDNKKVLVAGDTLNDLSMLSLGLPAVAVGGAEEGLIDEVIDMDHVHVATGIGVSGIAEAILKFEMFAAK